MPGTLEVGDADQRAGQRAGNARWRPAVAVLVRAAAVAAVLAVAVGGCLLVTHAATPTAAPVTTQIPGLEIKAAQVRPGTAAPVDASPAGGMTTSGTAPQQRPQQRSVADLLDQWSQRAAPVVGIPARALLAYGNAELSMRAERPDCKVSWATLAGIGRIESNHGRYGGADLRQDGRPSKPIIGVPLDGSPGVATIGDSDRGRFDGDVTHDRAVGPMQFIPTTWARYASDGNGDGVGDPQQIDDATLAAARYLCAGGRDMASAEGWWSGILSYNKSTEYAQKVFGLADEYAKAARAVRAG